MTTTTERVTITLPGEIVAEIDRLETNRSRFVLDAVRRELERRRREELRRSLRTPHPQAEEVAEAGFDEWAGALPADEASGLVDLTSGTPVQWKPGDGWQEKGE